MGVPDDRARAAVSPSSSGLRLDAAAKLNLGLRVTGRREDGWHELEGIFVLLDLADRLLLMPGCSGLRVEGEGMRDLPLDERNLAWRGLVAGLDGPPDLACLTLEKRIPAAAGLGGGSSDAAAAWRLGRAWRGRPDAADVDELVALSTIGADVPFFASGVAAAEVTGIGERVRPIRLGSWHAVLARPAFGLSTAAVFHELRRDEWGTADNDLLAPALRLRPELGDVLAAVRRAGGEPRLTGSGSTVFTLTDDSERAGSVADRLRDAGLSVILTRTRTEPPRIEAIHPEEEDEA